MPRLHIGIDPAPNTCVASLVDESGQTVGKALHFTPNRSGVEGLVKRVHERVPQAQCHFFVESSGLSWYAPSALLRDQGETVSLINPSYTKAQRKVSSRHAKSDAKDAEAIARAPFSMGHKGYHPADIPEGPRLNLRMLCRHRHTLQQEATAIKLRLLAWLGLTSPGLTAVLGTDLSEMDREFVRRYPVVARIVKLGPVRVREFLQRRSQGEFDPAVVDELFALAQEAYQPKGLDDKQMAFQIGMELEHLELLEKHIAELQSRIDVLYRECDPQGLAKSLPGFGKVVAPILVAEAGTDVTRFATVERFASWTGIVGRAHGTAGRQQEGLPITKAGRSITKWALHMAANVAVQHDRDLRELYDRLRAKGKHHNTALTAVAHKLANRYWAVMRGQRPYVPPRPLASNGSEKGSSSGEDSATPCA
jgi:transposase